MGPGASWGRPVGAPAVGCIARPARVRGRRVGGVDAAVRAGPDNTHNSRRTHAVDSALALSLFFPTILNHPLPHQSQELDGAPEHVIKMRQMDRELRALQEVAAAAGGPAPPRPTHPGERDMGFEEKRRLSTALGSLPCDKLGKALDIVAAAHPLPEGADEVELDIDALGRETLWKLDAYCLSVMPVSGG